ncbi:hypothetical protein [Parafrankia sp. BMG5.11]|uniref:hypothetical protein n=1 Tax=Parafrankia sp. BMG5.11 TaxID=222540 RepID=UPI00103F1659|nr:hypothetical protein [Parafrankia sp. BMG5.11]TCJ40094.1 hypothetical protein E0504_06540 [Parafrankia sp. BMG5.11]
MTGESIHRQGGEYYNEALGGPAETAGVPPREPYGSLPYAPPHIFSRLIPGTVPGAKLDPEDMARVTEHDWEEMQSLAKRYGWAVDRSHSRKRMDGSATVQRDGYAPYGTDDVTDDITQDAMLLYAQRLKSIEASCPVAETDEDTGQPVAWHYTRKDGKRSVATRETLYYWAVHDAAQRNGYRRRDDENGNGGSEAGGTLTPAPGGPEPGESGNDRPAAVPGDVPGPDGAAEIRGQVAARSRELGAVALALVRNTALASQSEVIWRLAFGDGRDFPVLRRLLPKAEQAVDLGRAPVLTETAAELHGSRSRRMIIRTRKAARKEWEEVSRRADEARSELARTETLKAHL